MQINVSLKGALIAAGVVLLLFVGLAAYYTTVRSGYEKQIVAYQNQIAADAKTIEVSNGVYQKASLQVDDLQKLLDQKNLQQEALIQQLNKQGDQLVAANNLVVQLKKALQAQATTTVVVTPPTEPGKPQGFEIKGSADFGPFNVICDTTGEEPVSAAAKTSILFSQKRPFKFSVVVSQEKDGSWRTSTTSSEADFNVDISLAAVNPYVLEPKWYEKIGLDVEVGIGTNPGLLGGVGATYGIGKFEVGPKVWVVIDHGVSPYFGAQMAWHPFAK